MQEKLENVHFHITIKHFCVTVEKHLVFDGFLFFSLTLMQLLGTNWVSFFTGPNPIIVYIVIFSKIMIKIVKVGNRIMFLKERKLTYFDETTTFLNLLLQGF